MGAKTERNASLGIGPDSVVESCNNLWEVAKFGIMVDRSEEGFKDIIICDYSRG